MDNPVYATLKGKKMMEDRLAECIAMREDAAAKIREAREFGDLKENAEYSAAREAQSNLEDEINNLQSKMQNLKVFSYTKVNTSCVNIGTRVTIQEVGKKKTQDWTITGVIENDPGNYYISNESPLGGRLLGKNINDIVDIQTPAGATKYKIIAINPGA